MTMQEAVIKNIDTDYSYQLAKRMEQFRSNEKLGYRPAGSKAEFLTGEMLKDEMQKLGLSDVCKNAVTVDGWEFKNAELTFETKEGKRHTALLGAYQTDFVTDGEQAFSLMYLGKGTEADYEGKDVTGKLVLVDINQRDEWWINYPVYQAQFKRCGGSDRCAVWRLWRSRCEGTQRTGYRRTGGCTGIFHLKGRCCIIEGTAGWRERSNRMVESRQPGKT